MKYRSELLNICWYLLNKAKKQFGQVIKILRSDSAEEYFSFSFSTLFNSHGILH